MCFCCVVLKVFSCIGMIYNYRLWRNVWHELHALTSELDVRPTFPFLRYPGMSVAGSLIHYNECTLTVRCRGSSNLHIFVMLWVFSNHLPPELQVSTLTSATYPLNSFITDVCADRTNNKAYRNNKIMWYAKNCKHFLGSSLI